MYPSFSGHDAYSEAKTLSATILYYFLSRVSKRTRDIDIAILCVRPFVRLSVTFRYSIETA